MVEKVMQPVKNEDKPAQKQQGDPQRENVVPMILEAYPGIDREQVAAVVDWVVKRAEEGKERAFFERSLQAAERTGEEERILGGMIALDCFDLIYNKDALWSAPEAPHELVPAVKADFNTAKDFPELYEMLGKEGFVHYSDGTPHSAEELKKWIEGFRHLGELNDNTERKFTRNGNLRQAVRRLIEEENAVAEPEKSAPPAVELKLADVVSRAGTRSFEDAMKLIDDVSAIYKWEKEQPWRDNELVYLPADGEAIVVGDIHSRFGCLEAVLRGTNFVERVANGEKVCLVCTGDYIDRPPEDAEGNSLHIETFKVLETLLELKATYPNNVVLLQGNHEQGGVWPHEFPNGADEVYGENGPSAYEKYMGFFREMPLAAKTPNGVFIAHGGIASGVDDVDDIANPPASVRKELLWNDPGRGDRDGMYQWGNRGGEDIAVFGENAFDEFMGKIGSNIMIRAHQQEVSSSFDGRLQTVSSTDYKDEEKAYVTFQLSKPIKSTDELGIHYF